MQNYLSFSFNIQMPDFKVNLSNHNYPPYNLKLMHTSFRVLILIYLVSSVSALYEQQPVYQFMGLNLTQNHTPYSMILSNDEDKVALYFLNATTQKPQYKILRFDGSQRCRKRVSVEQQVLIGWPMGHNLMFLNKSQTEITLLGTDCGDPYVLGDFSSQLKGAKYSYSSKEDQSYASFLTGSNQIHEYNLGSNLLQKVYKPQINNQRIMSYEYSYNHRYLFVQVSEKGAYNESRVRMYESQSGNKVKDISSQIAMVKVINRGDYYIGVDTSDNNKLYKVDMTGKAQLINEFTQYDRPLGYCTYEDLLVSLQRVNQSTSKQQQTISQQPKTIVNLVIYSGSDGAIKQTIPLDYIPVQMRQTYMACNDNYLALMDHKGYIRVYKFNYQFPVLIVVTAMIIGVIIAALIIALLVMKKIKQQKHRQYVEMQEGSQVIAIQVQ